MSVLSWQTAYALIRVLFSCLIPSLLRNSGNEHQYNLSGAHKYFATWVQSLFYIYIHYDWNHLILITSNRILCLWHTENLHFFIIKAVYVCLIWTNDFLPLCKMFVRKHKMALYSLPFHNTVLRKVPEILPHRRQWPTQSLPGLVMIWQCKKPKQLQPWYWLIHSEYCFQHQMS